MLVKALSCQIIHGGSLLAFSTLQTTVQGKSPILKVTGGVLSVFTSTTLTKKKPLSHQVREATVGKLLVCTLLMSLYCQLVYYENSLLLSRSLSTASMGVKEQVDSVVKSEEDLRQYRALVLENNLKVLLISDPKTDKSAAALDVHIG